MEGYSGNGYSFSPCPEQIIKMTDPRQKIGEKGNGSAHRAIFTKGLNNFQPGQRVQVQGLQQQTLGQPAQAVNEQISLGIAPQA